MNHLQHSREIEQASFLLILAVVTIMLAVIVWPFATSLLWSALAAIMFQPLYKWSLKKMRGRRNPAALLSLTIIFFAVLVPALWLGSMVVNEMLQVVDQFRRNPIDLSATFEMVYDMLPAIAQDAIDDSGWTDLSAAQQRIQEFFGESAGLIASQAVSIGGGALNFVFAFTLGLYVTFFLLRDGSRIGETVLSSVPVERSIADRLADRFLGIVRATIKGSVVVGIVQGTLGAITFAIVGLPSVVLFGVLMAILSLVPVVGTVLVWGPAGVYLLVTGSVWQGLFVLGSGFIVVSSADNVLRPILVGRDTGIPDWIILVTTLGGISFVGFSGIVLGPLVAGLFLASWSILQEMREDNQAVSDDGSSPKRRPRVRVGSDGRVPKSLDPASAKRTEDA